jgi:magnesium-transporting ATPase (P-type)
MTDRQGEQKKLQESPWHVRQAREALDAFDTDRERGLSASEAKQRLERYGPNSIASSEAEPWWRILLNQFLDPLIYILIAAGIVTLVFQDYIDSAVIFAAVLINATIGFIQEFRAQKAITSLAEMSAPKAHLLRDGEKVEIATDEVVPGDIVQLSSGTRVPADLRLLDADDLQVDESALTGEAESVRKQVEPVEDERAVPGDQLSMVFAATNVIRGRGLGVVVHTGEASQLGQIAERTREVGKVRTPIQEKMDDLGKLIGVGILVLAGVVAAVGFFRGMTLHEITETIVAMAVGAVPEALPVVLTVVLAMGVRRMADRNAIIRTLPSVETLGSTTVIASDKTGTLTSNQMTVRAIVTGGRRYDVSGSGYATEGEVELAGDAHEEGSGLDSDEALRMTLLAGLLANETEALPAEGEDEDEDKDEDEDEDEGPRGDPTELALLVSAVKAGMDLAETRANYDQLDVIPFESERKYMATLNRMEDGSCIFVKGAPEAVVERCSSQILPDGEEEDLDPDAAIETAHKLAAEGYRVLGTAFRRVHQDRFDDDEVGSDLVFAGFQGMEDPLRSDTKEAVATTRRAGIRVIMLTGDHANTAKAIGNQLGIVDEGGEAKEGRNLDDLSDEQLDEVVKKVNVYARVSPDHKLRLVERLKEQGHVVAVTGDGVNDAPALQAAHLGVAMGQAGTDVAREASDMILTDDNFASITNAVEEGRLVFANIRKVTYFLLSTGLAIVFTILFSLFVGWPLPYLAVQVLWINLVTNGLQDIALAFEKGEPGLLDDPPRNPDEGVINREVLIRLAWVSVLITAATMGVFYWMLQQDLPLEQVRSIAMTQMVMFQFFHVFNSRSMRRSIFQIPLSANPFLMLSLGVAILAHIGALHLPFMQSIFNTMPLDPLQWALVVGVGSVIVVAVEIEKVILRRRDRKEKDEQADKRSSTGAEAPEEPAASSAGQGKDGEA